MAALLLHSQMDFPTSKFHPRLDHAGPCWRQVFWRRRAFWRRVGVGRDRVYRLAVSDPIFWPLVGAYLDVETGAS